MWTKGWRQETWLELNQDWDIVIIGGGITGAGIFRRAVSEGFKTLLVEAKDFSSGTSSRSSKMVHGGFRYLRNKQFNVTKESVREREWMLKEARNLVTPLGFLMPCPSDVKISSQFALGVAIYDLLAPKWKHRFLTKQKMLSICPEINPEYVKGGFLYYDAGIDDSRLVIRILQETVADGGTALNYAKVTNLLKNNMGAVCGIVLEDQSDARMGEIEIKSQVVINASGPWSDEVRGHVNAPARLRKLRGSHLVFPFSRLPLQHAVTLLHPRDRRAMFALPWQGVTLIGTTDLDHADDLSRGEPFTTPQEIEYILQAAEATFPCANLTHGDVLSSFAGLRPVINTGIADPSKESRAHVVWDEKGLITVTGGKLTTFRIMAEETLRKAAPHLSRSIDFEERKCYFKPLPKIESNGMVLTSEMTYLLGRYGDNTTELISSAQPGENGPIGALPNLWSEIRWNARTGAVEHLDDLLLRRVRIGLLLPEGAAGEIEKIKVIAQNELGWDDEKWHQEEIRYQEIYKQSYCANPTGYIENSSIKLSEESYESKEQMHPSLV
jgi:glycerol-3-phosphate dehydrogenase